MTLKELAAACGLSVSAVSKALNGYPDVSDETRRFVQGKAVELGYRPNALARALKSGRTYTLGILYTNSTTSGLTHSFFGPVIDAFKNAAEARGYEVSFISQHKGPGSMTYLEHCRTRGFDGICIVNFDKEDPEVTALAKSDFPLVSIDYPYPERSCIRSDNAQGILQLTRYVLSMGHKQIAFLSGEETGVTINRRNGFLQVMQENGLKVPAEYLAASRYHNPDAAHRAVDRLLNLPEPPTCIMMSDDLSALGGMEAIHAHGLRIPEDISIVGYDGVHLLQMCTPRLTTYAQNTETIGQMAADELIRVIANAEGPRWQTIVVQGRLIVGDTVARIG